MSSDGLLSVVGVVPTSEEEELERKQIDLAVAAGFEDPTMNDQRPILFPEFDGIEFRRFIIEFSEIQHDHIFQAQIRQNVVNTTYCKEDLIPKIQRDGLRKPIFVQKTGVNSCSLDHGHHRFWSYGSIYGSESFVPCYVLSNVVYPILEDGSYGEPVSIPFLMEISKIKCNPPAKNIPYTCADVAVQLRTLFAADSKFRGLNPEGTFPKREVFDDIMDKLHPDQFLNKGTRTKIYNMWSKGRTGSKIRPVDYSDVTNDLVQFGFDAGVTQTKGGKASREKFLEWQDKNKNVFLGVGDANSGTNFERNFCLTLMVAAADGIFDNKTNYDFVIHCTVYKPAPSIVKLNAQRKEHEDFMRTWNTRFKNLGFPNVKFTKVIWPKQLVDPQDVSKVVTL